MADITLAGPTNLKLTRPSRFFPLPCLPVVRFTSGSFSRAETVYSSSSCS